MHVLVVYDTVYGSTAQIAGWIAERLEGFEDTAVAVSRVSENPDLEDYDAVIIGSPIYRNDQILESIKDFVTENKEAMAEKRWEYSWWRSIPAVPTTSVVSPVGWSI